MKKSIYSLLFMAMAAFTFCSCEDVPAPYNTPTINNNDGDSDGTSEAKGTGTVSDPYNCAAAVKYCQSLESGVESDKDVYVKGKVKSIESQYSTQYGNVSVTIVDEDDNTTFKIWRAYYFDNKKWTTGDKEIQIGDEVVFCGKVVNFSGNTPETVQGKAWLYSLNGKTSEGDDTNPDGGEAKGTGTASDPFNSVAAQKYAEALTADAATEQEFYIKGKILEVEDAFSSNYGNASFYIADDENSTKFYIFRTYYFGGEKWKEGNTQIKVGDEVVVCAKLINYKGNTPETNAGGKIISLNGKTSDEGGDTTPDSGDTSAANGDFETWVDGLPNNWKTTSSAGNATLSQSTDAHGGKYSVEVTGTSSSNKRLGYKEMTLKAGTYKIKYYVKAASATGASVQSGFVPVTDGSVGNYVYSGYINDITNTAWTLVEQDIEIPSDGTYSIVIMVSKKPGGSVLVDDLTLTLNGTAIIK